MSETLKIVLLAIIQGLTEFLPVSSSGHLVIANRFIGLDSPGVLWEVVIHVGTMISVTVYYRHRLLRIVRGMWTRGSAEQAEVLWLFIATIPIALTGVLFTDTIEALFTEPRFVAAMLVVTGVTLLTLLRVPREVDRPLNARRALCLGIAQAFALIPGISRSGSTITIARHLGMRPREAAEFALLMMLPAVSGALVFALREAAQDGIGTLHVGQLAIGLVVSALVGYAAIALLVRALSSGAFPWFGVYCIAAGLVGAIFI